MSERKKKRESQTCVLQAICDVHWQLPEHHPDTAPAFCSCFLLLSHSDFPVFYRVCCHWDLVRENPGCPNPAHSSAESNPAHPLANEGLLKPARVCQRQEPQHPAPGLLQVVTRALCSCQVRRRCSAGCHSARHLHGASSLFCVPKLSAFREQIESPVPSITGVL